MKVNSCDQSTIHTIFQRQIFKIYVYNNLFKPLQTNTKGKRKKKTF